MLMTFVELVESGMLPRHWITREHIVQTEGQQVIYVGKMCYDESKFARAVNRFGRLRVKRIEGHRASTYYDLLITLANS